MPDGVQNLMSLPCRVTATGALVVTVGTAIASTGSDENGGVNTFPELQGKVNADHELEMRVGS